jgi:Cys-rich protein (TIGR01571 family)
MAVPIVPDFDLAEKEQAPLTGAAEFMPQPPPTVVPALTLWSTDLCSCFKDCPSAMDAFFCDYCQLSRQYNTYMTGSNTIHWPVCCAAFGADVFGVAAIGVAVGTWALSYVVRNRLRQRYNIMGDELSDLCVAGFCSCCSVAQNYREMSLRGEWPAGSCCVKHPFSLRHPEDPVMGEQVC